MKTTMSDFRINLFGALGTGFLLALCWPPLPLGFLVLVAFIPLFWVEEIIIEKKQNKLIYFFCVFIAMLLWHLVSLRWFINMSFKDGIIVSIIDSLLIASFLMIPHLLKRYGKYQIGHFAFICFWISFELLQVNWELSFPLLSLGTSLGMFPQLIQWYEWTGVIGGSIWILTINILAFKLVRKIKLQRKTGKKIKLKNGYLYLSLVLLVPILWSLIRFFTYQENGRSIEVVAIHPNINCYTEKYKWSSEQLLSRYLSCTFQQISPETDYVLWPENAIPNTEWASELDQFLPFQFLKDSLKRFPKAKIITGGISYDLYPHKKINGKYPVNVTHSPNLNQAYYTYNAAFQLEAGKDHVAMRSKQQLVPVEESIPYGRWLGFLRDISGSLGGYVFSASKKNEHVFRAADGTKVTPLICYESAFGGATANYVQQGAQVLFVLLNEGWYKHQQGAQQFLYLSAIRAIETRRCVARSSNDGISGFINQRGEILQLVNDYQPLAIKQSLKLNSKLTLYTYFKDLLAQIAAFLAFALALYTLFLNKIRVV